MSISRRPTVPLSLSHRQSHFNQHIPYVSSHAPGAHHRRLVHIQLPRNPRYALSLTNVRSFLPSRRSPSRRRTSRRGLFPSSTSLSDCLPKSLMAKIIGTQHSSSRENIYTENVQFRWSKISKAMGGRRNPRQVASRAQSILKN